MNFFFANFFQKLVGIFWRRPIKFANIHPLFLLNDIILDSRNFILKQFSKHYVFANALIHTFLASVYSQSKLNEVERDTNFLNSIYSVLFNCVFLIEKTKWHTNIIWIYLYRQHCTLDFGSYTKDLSAICADLSSVFILDNSPGAYRSYPGKTNKQK